MTRFFTRAVCWGGLGEKEEERKNKKGGVGGTQKNPNTPPHKRGGKRRAGSRASRTRFLGSLAPSPPRLALLYPCGEATGCLFLITRGWGVRGAERREGGPVDPQPPRVVLGELTPAPAADPARPAGHGPNSGRTPQAPTAERAPAPRWRCVFGSGATGCRET